MDTQNPPYGLPTESDRLQQPISTAVQYFCSIAVSCFIDFVCRMYLRENAPGDAPYW